MLSLAILTTPVSPVTASLSWNTWLLTQQCFVLRQLAYTHMLHSQKEMPGRRAANSPEEMGIARTSPVERKPS